MATCKFFSKALSVIVLFVAPFSQIQQAQARASDDFMNIKIPQRVITGKVVTQEDGAPLIGVSVTIKGASGGTVTDVTGAFSLNVPDDDAVLVFSYLGYITKEVAVQGKEELRVALAQDNQELSQVVVIGYGTVRKSDLTGSVSSVKAEELKAVPVTSFDQALQGRAAGVQVTQTTGAPGGETNIRIRGTSSVNASSEPCM